MSGFRKLSIAAAAVGAAMALAGCGGDPDPVYHQAFGFQCANSDNFVADIACSNRPAGHNTEQVSRYCYKTIGDANCFDRPDMDRKNQALGSSGY